MRSLVGVGDPARHLLHPEIFISPRVQSAKGFGITFQYITGTVAEQGFRGVSGLYFADGKVDGSSIDAGRSSCFKPFHLKTQHGKIGGKAGRSAAHSASCYVLKAHMKQSLHECPGADNHAAGMDGAAQRSNGSRCLLFSIDEQFDHISLKQAYAGGGFQNHFHSCAVGCFIALGAGSAHAGPLGSVQHPELNGGSIRVQPHRSPHGIYFPDDMPFGKSPDSRIAGHLSDSIQVMS